MSSSSSNLSEPKEPVYDILRASPLSLRTLFELIPFYYPIGNTSGRNILSSLAQLNSTRPVTRTFFGGVGDLRNVLSTVSDGVVKGKRQFEFVLNDADPYIIARDLLLLYIGLTDPEDVFLWMQVWSSATITLNQRDKLVSILQKLLDGAELPQLCVEDSDTRSKIRECWSFWIDAAKNITADQVAEARKKRFTAEEKRGGSFSESMLDSTIHSVCRINPVGNGEEIKHWAAKGSLLVPSDTKVFKPPKEAQSACNPTMLKPHDPDHPWYRSYAALLGEQQNQNFIWAQHAWSFPFYAISATTPDDFNSPKKSFFDIIYNVTRRQLQKLTDCKDQLRFFFVIDDVFRAMAKEKLCSIDSIDLSNLGDNVGMINLLLAAQPLLRDADSLIFAESMKSLTHALASDETRSSPPYDALGKIIGFPLHLSPFLFGLQSTSFYAERPMFADEIRSGLPFASYTTTFSWMKCADGFLPKLSLAPNSSIRSAIEAIVDRLLEFLATSGENRSDAKDIAPSLTSHSIVLLLNNVAKWLVDPTADLIPILSGIFEKFPTLETEFKTFLTLRGCTWAKQFLLDESDSISQYHLHFEGEDNLKEDLGSATLTIEWDGHNPGAFPPRSLKHLFTVFQFDSQRSSISCLFPASLMSASSNRNDEICLMYHSHRISPFDPIPVAGIVSPQLEVSVSSLLVASPNVESASSLTDDSLVKLVSMTNVDDALYSVLSFSLPQGATLENVKPEIVVGGEYSDELHVFILPSKQPHGIIKMPSYITLSFARGGKIQLSRAKQEFYVTTPIGHPVDCAATAFSSSAVDARDLLPTSRTKISTASAASLKRFPRNVRANACLVDVDLLPSWPKSFDFEFLTFTMFSIIEIASSRGIDEPDVGLGPSHSAHRDMRESIATMFKFRKGNGGFHILQTPEKDEGILVMSFGIKILPGGEPCCDVIFRHSTSADPKVVKVIQAAAKFASEQKWLNHNCECARQEMPLILQVLKENAARLTGPKTVDLNGTKWARSFLSPRYFPISWMEKSYASKKTKKDDRMGALQEMMQQMGIGLNPALLAQFMSNTSLKRK